MEAYRKGAGLPAGEARSLPFPEYRDPAVFDLEIERMFRSDWIAVGAEAALAEPGDRPGIGGEPVAPVRDGDGQLRALPNTGRHCGTPLFDPGVARRAAGRPERPRSTRGAGSAGREEALPPQRPPAAGGPAQSSASSSSEAASAAAAFACRQAAMLAATCSSSRATICAA